jgi:type I restriction enzyme S subunit
MTTPGLVKVEDLLAERVLLIGDGYRAKNEELGSAGLPFARAGNINGGFNFEEADCFPVENLQRVGEKVSQPGDVVFTSKGTVGRFAFVRAETPRFVYSPQLCFWRSLDQQRIHPPFLYYWMSGREFFLQYSGVKGQTDMADYVSLSDQRRMRITLPPIDTQRAIAGILDALDEKIELNRRMNETMEAMARAIFKSWFVDFDPVRAKAKGEQPAGMDAGTAALFPGSFEESNTERPAGWGSGSFLDIAELLSGGTPKTTEPAFWNGDVPWASAQDVSQCGSPFLVRTSRTITSRGVEESATQLIPALSTVVVARGATTGRHAMFGQQMAMNQTCYGLKAKARDDYFLYCFFGSEVGGLVNAAHGSVFDTITTSTFRSSELVVPPAEIRLRFNALVAPVFERILAHLEESRTLATLRDSLLPKLLSGELRVKEGTSSSDRS